jgi:hypothetical protein
MSSIDPKQARLLDRFYDGYLRPRAEAGWRVAVTWAGPPPEPGASYFVRRPRTRLGRSEFELDLGDPHRAAGALERAWAGTPLRDLAKPLMKLAPAFQDVEERSEVSSFVYEMF